MCDDRSPSSHINCGHAYGDSHDGTAGRCDDGTAGRCADRTPMTYDSPMRLIEWLTDRIAEKGYAG